MLAKKSIKAASILILSFFIGRTHSAFASNGSRHAAEFASGAGDIAYLSLSVALPLIEDGAEGPQRSIRTLDSILTTSAVTEVLKEVVREKRPDGAGHSSFPSGHATAATAAAVMQSEYHPIQTPFWAAGAALISISRVKLHRHYTHDVLAGAAIGGLGSELELYSKRGLLLFPVVAAAEHRIALQAVFNF